MNFNPSAFIDNLYYMGTGMLSIAIVIGVIALVTALLNRITSTKDDAQQDSDKTE